ASAVRADPKSLMRRSRAPAAAGRGGGVTAGDAVSSARPSHQQQDPGPDQARRARPPATSAPPPSATPPTVAVRDPRCVVSREPRMDAPTLCTAVAPDDVFTIRTYGDTRAVIARHHLAVPKRQAEGW